MPSSEPSSDESRARASRHVRIEKIVDHLRGMSVDDAGEPDIAGAVDLLVEMKIDRALYMGSHSAARIRRSSNMPRDPHLAKHDERCEAARINLRRMLARHGAGR